MSLDFRKIAGVFNSFILKLPIPEILEISPFSPHYIYCISRRLPGITLQDSAISILQKLTLHISQA